MRPRLNFILVLTSILFYGVVVYAQESEEILNQANALIYSNPEKSIQLAEKIYKESKNGSQLQLSALIVLGTASSEKFDVERSIQYLLEAQRIAEQQKDHINQIRALSLLGYQYQILQINDKAHDYLDRAEAIMEQWPLPDSLLYLRGNNYSIKALTYKESLDCDYAVEYFNKSIEVYKKIHESEIGQINSCIAHLNKATCFLENKNLDSARISLQKTNQILKKIRVADDIVVSQNVAWGKYHYLQGNNEKSINYLMNALRTAENMTQVDIDLEIYQLLSENYRVLNDIEKYNYYSRLYTEARKNLSEAEKRSITYIINEPPGEPQKKEDKTSKIFVYIGLILLLIILILTIYMAAKSRRLKQKMKQFDSVKDSD